ncbi:MAG TPA: shikimate kinase [Williamwhitmania sp.]|nr:shikimate kinase [Williamwhitmania sp.]
MNIYLVGFMASGKTTLGRQLAELLGMRYIDMDEHIELQTGKTIRQIFVTQGEEHFRKVENEILLDLTSQNGLVVATGGGSPCFYNNMEAMNTKGLTIYIKVSVEALVNRLADSKVDRPLLWGKSVDELTAYIKEMLRLREPYYSTAKLVITSDEPTAAEIAAAVRPKLN